MLVIVSPALSGNTCNLRCTWWTVPDGRHAENLPDHGHCVHSCMNHRNRSNLYTSTAGILARSHRLLPITRSILLHRAFLISYTSRFGQCHTVRPSQCPRVFLIMVHQAVNDQCRRSLCNISFRSLRKCGGGGQFYRDACNPSDGHEMLMYVGVRNSFYTCRYHASGTKNRASSSILQHLPHCVDDKERRTSDI